MTDAPDRWTRVGEAVTRRMAERGLGPTELAKKAGVSRETIRPLMRAERDVYRDTTLQRISIALWDQADAIQRLLAGEQPADLEPDPDTGDVWAALKEVRSRLQRLEGDVRRVLDAVAEQERREM